ncbi:MAG TPA: glycoside hydrolase family 36 protein, partial [Chloroflexota bacterium]|nr:glycoside hydrolase family 36 protein [Chloroflexota bacterium]
SNVERRFTRARALSAVAALGGGALAACTPGRFDGPGALGFTTARAASSGRPAGSLAARVGMDRVANAAVGDAFIHYDPDARAWTIGNARVQERLELQTGAEGGFALARRELVSRDRSVSLDIEWIDADQAADVLQDALGIAIDGRQPRLAPLDQQVSRAEDGAVYAALRFRDIDTAAELTHEVRLRPGHPVVEHRSSIAPSPGPALRLTRLDAADLVVRSGPNARWRAATMDNDGNLSFARLGQDGELLTQVPAQSAARAPVVPLLVLHDAANAEGLFLGLRWSVNYRIVARSVGDRRVALEAGVRMRASAEMDSMSTIDQAEGFLVKPGQTIESPWLMIGVFEGSMEDGTNVLKSYLTDDRAREPTWAAEVMPVGWNSWFAYGKAVDFESMRAEARAARLAGAEVFYVDYGWSKAQGDWVPHPQRFPGRTLRQLSDQVHTAGMRFGLWVAFGVADEDSDLLARHPDFRARQPAPARTGIDGSLPLCLSQAKTYLQGELARIVRDYRVDWLKFDQPMVAACMDFSHGHDPSVRGSLHANTQAFYELVDGLRAAFPGLFVESTFDGAGYLDYGVFARSHAAWLDDAAGDPTAPMQKVQQSAYGATLAFPPRFLTLWLARAPVGEGAPGRGTSPEDLAYQGYSTMGGGWGISLRLDELDDAQTAVVRRLVDDYRTLRAYLPGAHVYHLAPALTAMLAAPGVVTAGPMVREWFALQFHQPELDRGAVLAVHNEAGVNDRTLTLRGLTPEKGYEVAWIDGTSLARDDGAALMAEGVRITLPPLTGGVALVRPLT